MNDEIWFSNLFESNYELLYRVGRVFLGGNSNREMLIEEQIQETFLKAWEKRNSLRQHPNPSGWLVECFRKRLMNACRRQIVEWKHRAYSVDQEAQVPLEDKSGLSPDAYASSREQIELLTRLLGNKDAETFLRHCVYGEKVGEIAKELNVSEQALRMKISRIKKKILGHKEMFACVLMICFWSIK